jgi:hypothetical protein
LPWDFRIHSKERTKNADGSWRSKRGIDKVELTAVEAELAAAMAFPLSAPPAPLPPQMTFSEFMLHVTPMLTSGGLTEGKLLSVLPEFGLPHLGVLAARPDLLAPVLARLHEVAQ